MSLANGSDNKLEVAASLKRGRERERERESLKLLHKVVPEKVSNKVLMSSIRCHKCNNAKTQENMLWFAPRPLQLAKSHIQHKRKLYPESRELLKVPHPSQ